MIPEFKEEPPLPFPLKPLIFHGELIEEYEIPEDQKEAVLKELYLFDPVPSLEAEFFDLHSGKSSRSGIIVSPEKTGVTGWLVHIMKMAGEP